MTTINYKPLIIEMTDKVLDWWLDKRHVLMFKDVLLDYVKYVAEKKYNINIFQSKWTNQLKVKDIQLYDMLNISSYMVDSCCYFWDQYITTEELPTLYVAIIKEFNDRLKIVKS